MSQHKATECLQPTILKTRMNLSAFHKYLALRKKKNPQHIFPDAVTMSATCQGDRKSFVLWLFAQFPPCCRLQTQWGDTTNKRQTWQRKKLYFYFDSGDANTRLTTIGTKNWVSNSTAAKLLKSQPRFTAITSLSQKNMRLSSIAAVKL